MKLHINSIIVSCLIIVFLIFFSIVRKQKEYIDNFKSEYKYSLLKEEGVISASLSKLVQSPTMKHSIENNLDNSLSKSLENYTKNNLSIFLLYRDCSLLYSSSNIEGLSNSICTYLNNEDHKLDSNNYFSYNGKNYILDKATIVASTKNIDVVVLSEINDNFVRKYPSLSLLYKKLNIFIGSTTTKWSASNIMPVFEKSGYNFISKKFSLKIIPSFFINNLSWFFSLGLVFLVFLLIANNFMILIKLYKDRVKLNIDITKFFDWISSQSSNFSSFLSKNSFMNNVDLDIKDIEIKRDQVGASLNSFSYESVSEDVLAQYKDQILLFITNAEKEIEKNIVRISSLENKLKKQELKNKNLSIQLSYFSEIESFYIQVKRLFYSLLSKMEDINIDINTLNTISKEVFESFGKDFFNILNEWKTNIEQRGVKRFLRYLSEVEVDRNVTLLDFQLEHLIDSGTKIYDSSTSIVSRLNQIFVSVSNILKIFGIWEKYLYHKSTENSSSTKSFFNVSSSILDAQTLIKQEESNENKEDIDIENDSKDEQKSSVKVEFINYNISTDDISKDISENTWTSFMYHIYLSYLKVANFLKRDIKIYTGFKATQGYSYLIVGSNIKESFSENILSKFYNIQKLDLDISSRLVEGFNISRINFTVTDTLPNIGYSWKSINKGKDQNQDKDKNMDINIEESNKIDSNNNLDIKENL